MFIFEPTKYFPQCHASTVEYYVDGHIYSAWFAGTKEADPDTAIWMSYFDLDKTTWKEPFVIAKISDKAHWNPVLFRVSDKLYLFFRVGTIIDTWETWYKVYDGLKWSEEKKLIGGKASSINRGPVRSKPIITKNGIWIAPCSSEVTINKYFDCPSDVVWKSFVDISEDGGNTWFRSKDIDFDREKYGLKDGQFGGVIQPTLWESGDGVHMLLRSTAGFIFRSDSKDGGYTWCDAYATDLPNNNSGIDVVNTSGMLLLAYNPVSGNWASRTPISIISSLDDGKTWVSRFDIRGGMGSFSYPSLCVLPEERRIGMTYTWNRMSIDFVKISISANDSVK